VKNQNPYLSWQSPSSWKFRIIYFSKEDPRIIEPKRTEVGYTVNCAKPMAVPALVVMILPVLAAKAFFSKTLSPVMWTGCIVLYLIVLIFICRYLASEKESN